MKKQFIFIALFAILSTMSVHAREYSGVQFPEQLTQASSGKILQLNGVGMRTKFVFDVYIGALYTLEKVGSREELNASDQANRVVMHFVYNEVSAKKLVKGWNKGFEENQSDESLERLATRIQTFNDMFATLKAGDMVVLDYVPGKGTEVTIKGENKGTIEGAGFNDALLDIWLGEEPADNDLKEGMLGQ